jgi:phosphoribosylpyrophosphate synthetase
VVWSAHARWPSSSDCDLAIIDKRRPSANVSEVMHVIGEIEGRNCVIMDDMIDTAGTLVESSRGAQGSAAPRRSTPIARTRFFPGPAIERIAQRRRARRSRRHQHHSAEPRCGRCAPKSANSPWLR